MSNRFSLGEFSEFLDDSDGHRLAQFLQKKSGKVPTGRRIFDYQPEDISLNVIAVPLTLSAEKQVKAEHIEDPENDQVQFPNQPEPDLHTTITNVAATAVVENVQSAEAPVNTRCEGYLSSPMTASNSPIQAPPVNYPMQAPLTNSPIQSTLVNSQIQAPLINSPLSAARQHSRVSVSLQKSPRPSPLSPRRLQRSGGVSTADKLRRQTLKRWSSLGGGRRTLLTEFESTLHTPDFVPPVCSTPMQSQPSKSPSTPPRHIASNNSERGTEVEPVDLAENATSHTSCLPLCPDEDRLRQVLSQVLEITLDKIVHGKENREVSHDASLAPNHSSRSCSPFLSHHNRTIKDSTKNAKQLPATQELLNEAQKLLQTMHDSQVFQVPKIVIPINQTINGIHTEKTSRDHTSDEKIQHNTQYTVNENTSQRQNNSPRDEQDKREVAAQTSSFDNRPEDIHADAHLELHASVQKKCPQKTQSINHHAVNEDASQNKSCRNIQNKTYDAAQNKSCHNAPEVIPTDAHVELHANLQNKSQQTTFTEKQNCTIPKQRSTICSPRENIAVDPVNVNELELRLSDIITEDENAETEINIKNGALNLATKRQLTEPCRRSRRFLTARRRAKSPPLSTDTEIESGQPQTHPLNMRSVRYEKIKNPSSKRPLNKEPCTPKNGEIFAIELKEHFARLSNMEILDMRKRNSSGQFFPGTGRQGSRRACKDNALQKRLLLEEKIQLEILRRRLEGTANNDFDTVDQLGKAGEIVATSQHEDSDIFQELLQVPDTFQDNNVPTTSKKTRVPQEDIITQITERTHFNSCFVDEQIRDLVSFNASTRLNAQMEQSSHNKSRFRSKHKQETSEIVKNYLEIRKQINKNKSVRKSKRSLYSRGHSLSEGTDSPKNNTIAKNDDKVAPKSPTLLTPPTPFSSPPPTLFTASPGQPSAAIENIRIVSPPSPMGSLPTEVAEGDEIYAPPEPFLNAPATQNAVESSKSDDNMVFKKPSIPAPRKYVRKKPKLSHLSSAKGNFASTSDTIQSDNPEASNLRRSKRGQVPVRTVWAHSVAGSNNLLADMYGWMLESTESRKNTTKSRIDRSSVTSNYNWPRIASSTVNSRMMHDFGEVHTKSHKKSEKLPKRRNGDTFSGLGDTDITSSSAANSPTLRSSKVGTADSRESARKIQPLSAIIETPIEESDSNTEVEASTAKQRKRVKQTNQRKSTEPTTSTAIERKKRGNSKKVVKNGQPLPTNDELFDQLKQLETHENREVVSLPTSIPTSSKLPVENTAVQTDAPKSKHSEESDSNMEVEAATVKRRKRVKQTKQEKVKELKSTSNERKKRKNSKKVVMNNSQEFEPPEPEPVTEVEPQLLFTNQQKELETHENREVASVSMSKPTPSNAAIQNDAPYRKKKKNSNRGILNHSRVYVPSTPPMRQMNAMFEQLKNEAANPECDTSKTQRLPSKSLQLPSAQQRPSSSNATHTRKLRVRLPRTCSVEQSANSTNATASESESELLTWLKGIAQIQSADQSSSHVFMDMRCSTAGKLCFIDLEGIDYAFYNTKNKASLGYLRFKPFQKKPEKRTNKFHLHFVVLAGKFDFGTDREHGTFSVGDMVAINKGCRYTIENLLDDVGILMVIKK